MSFYYLKRERPYMDSPKDYYKRFEVLIKDREVKWITVEYSAPFFKRLCKRLSGMFRR